MDAAASAEAATCMYEPTTNSGFDDTSPTSGIVIVGTVDDHTSFLLYLSLSQICYVRYSCDVGSPAGDAHTVTTTRMMMTMPTYLAVERINYGFSVCMISRVYQKVSKTY
jgi:hypothetical protein